MKIRILEETGIKTKEYGHMKHDEIREVDEDFGAFACANGWAEDMEGSTPTGERGKLDKENPKKWAEEQKGN